MAVDALYRDPRLVLVSHLDKVWGPGDDALGAAGRCVMGRPGGRALGGGRAADHPSWAAHLIRGRSALKAGVPA